jgi:hypothetical protein
MDRAPTMQRAQQWGELSLPPLEMLATWRKGCFCPGPQVAGQACATCTLAMVNALERALRTTPVTEQPGVNEEASRLSLELRISRAADRPSFGWQLAWMNEPEKSGTYQVRFGKSGSDPVMELYFEATPGGGMWKSGEQPPRDHAVLPAAAQWRPIPDQGSGAE